MTKLEEALKRARKANLKPPPKLTVSEWADAERKLSAEASAESGQWRTSRAPYQRGIMDALNDKAVEQIVVMSSAQVGKTEFLLNAIGYFVHHDPSPMLLLQPTLEMAETFSKDRLAPMLRDTPALRGKVKDPRARDSGNTLLKKNFAGGHITLAGSNSPASLASRPVRIVLCDEIDRYPPSAGTEGDPVNLARKRTTTFYNRKIMLTSTPTVKGASRIESAYDDSDQRKYHVPCPECGEYDHLKWSNIRFDPEDPDPVYVCEHCGCVIEEKHKLNMLKNGEWVAHAPFKNIAGFHLNELYSPWRTWKEVVVDFLAAKKSPETLKTWVNTSLGETWEDQGERVDDYALAERREPLPALPDEVIVLTAGVDVQDNRLEVSVIGWGRDDESWVIEHQVLYGDPSTPQLWTDLDSQLFKTYDTESGDQMVIRGSCIDSGGHYTSQVYAYAKKNAGRRVFAIKGVGGAGKAVAGRPSKNNIGKCPLFPVGVDTIKDMLMARMRITDTGPGYIHFGDGLTDEYFRQLTAEKVVTRYHKGFPVREYQKMRPRNEALDCFVYSIAAYAIIGVNVNSLADRREAKTQQAQGRQTAVPKKPFVTMPTSRGNFATSW